MLSKHNYSVVHAISQLVGAAERELLSRITMEMHKQDFLDVDLSHTTQWMAKYIQAHDIPCEVMEDIALALTKASAFPFSSVGPQFICALDEIMAV